MRNSILSCSTHQRPFAGPLLLLAALAAVVGCDTEKSRNPLSPSIAGPIEGVTIAAPTPITPGQGSLVPVESQPVTLVFANATSTGERTVFYVLQVATDAEFGAPIHSVADIPANPSGQTSYQLPISLEPERMYYWRSRADDGANASPFSAAETFEVYTPLTIDTPMLVSPLGGAAIQGRTPTLVVTDAAITGPATNVTYRFEVASDPGFANVVTVLEVSSGGGEGVQASVGSSGTMPAGFAPPRGLRPAQGTTGQLDWSTTYHWRARASADGREGRVTGPWTGGGSFVTGVQPVEIGAPTHVSPIGGATASDNPPTFVVNNPSVTGQAGPVTIHYHVATDAAFNEVVHVFSAPMSSGSTTTTVSGLLPVDQLLHWRMFATDDTTIGPWSGGQNFRTPAAPMPPPPPPPGGGGGGGGAADQLNLGQVKWLHTNVSGWAKTSTITSTSIGGPPICINHTRSGSWPGISSSGTSTTVAGNPWIFAKVGGQWYGATFEWLRPGQTCKSISATELGPHIKKSPLDNWVPQSGETVGLMVSTPARVGAEGPINERSNVVLTTWP